VTFLFLAGVPVPIAEELEMCGILVHGERKSVDVMMVEEMGLAGSDESDLEADSDCFGGVDNPEQNDSKSAADSPEHVCMSESDTRSEFVMIAPISGSGNGAGSETVTDLERDDNLCRHFSASTTSAILSDTTATTVLDSSKPGINEGSTLPANQTPLDSLQDCRTDLALSVISTEYSVENSLCDASMITLANFDEDEFCESMKRLLLNLNMSLGKHDSKDNFHSKSSEIKSPLSSPAISLKGLSQICTTSLSSSLSTLLPAPPVINKANLDVTAMVCMVSNLANGSSCFIFKEDILTEQAEKERKVPMLPKIMDCIKGRHLANDISPGS
jgi:hypothetical protein